MSIFSKKEYSTKYLETVQDPNTGETIHRVSIDPELIDNINKKIAGHSGTMNEFVQNSVNFFEILERQLELKKRIKVADEEVKASMNDAMKKSKLDPKLPYGFNMLLKCFEYRKPPIVQGMTPAEIEKSNSPQHPPKIINKEGIGLKV